MLYTLTMIQFLYVFSDWGLLALRLVLGLIFLVHGWRKVKNLSGAVSSFEAMGFKPAKFWGPFVAFLEFVGGIALIVGIVTQVFAALFFVQFVVAILKVTGKKGFAGGYEFDLLILAALLALVVLGSGSFSADSMLGLLLY